MAVAQKCPEAARLQQLVAGELPLSDEVELIQHLDSCTCCPGRMEALAAGNEALVAAAREVGREELPANSAYWPAVKQLSREVGQTVDGVDTRPDTDFSLDFLTPSPEEGHLGRLSHYDVVNVIGRGGMGVVLKAFDTHLQRNVALKVMSPELTKDETARKRFCREARAAAKITHEHVVAVHQVAHEEERGVPFLVMQLVSGESLEQRLARQGPLPLKELVRIGMEIASGLAAAHAHDLIHRDIKPDNILLESPGDRVKLTDFGLARAAEDVKLTASGLIAGTPAYMSPEQARGEPLDARSDLFSYGSVLYAMATGHPPFDGGNSFVVLRKITEEDAKPIHEVNPQMPIWLTQIIARLHAKNPDDRFQSAQEVADLLRYQLARLESAEAPALPSCPGKRRALWPWAGAGTGLLGAALAIGAWSGVFTPAPVLPTMHGENAPSPQLRATLNGNSGPVWSLAAAPDASVAAMAIEDGTVKFWDVKAGRIRTTINAHKGSVWSVAFSRDGKLLATASDDSVKLWDPADGREVLTIPQTAAVRSMAFGPNNRLVAGGRGGQVGIWDALTGKEVVTTRGHSHTVLTVAYSPDGKTLASGSADRTVKLWDAGTGQERLTLQGHAGSIHSVAFSPDSTKVATGSWDKTVKLWDVATGNCIATLPGHTQDVWAVAFSPDGKTLASASEDRTVKLWDVATEKEITTLHGHTGALYTVSFCPHGDAIASGGRDGTVRLWNIAR